MIILNVSLQFSYRFCLTSHFKTMNEDNWTTQCHSLAAKARLTNTSHHLSLRPQQEETGGFDGGGRTKSSKRRPEELIQMLDEFGSSYPSFAERCDHLNSASSHESNSMSTPPPDQNGSSEDFALAASCSHHHVDGDLNVKQGVSFDESRGIVPWFLILFSL